MNSVGKFIFLVFLLLSVSSVINAGSNDLCLAFPGAEGAGKYTTGGRAGIVYTVTNLNDDGPGSLRDGIQKKGSRIIVFAVSGYIDLNRSLDINNDNITIAGQTAPGDGICLRNYGIKVSADNVIIRYLRIRPGDSANKELDALTGKKQKNIIIDHCSVSWATDEVCSFYDVENFTLQNCLITESFNKSVHHKGEHGYGGIWGGMGASFHHNLLAHHVSRNPRLNGSRFGSKESNEKAEIVNNVVYNWGETCMYAGEQGSYIIMGNYLKPGPATSKKEDKTFFEPYKPFGKFLFAENVMANRKEVTKNNKLAIEFDNKADIDSVLLNANIKISDMNVQKAQKVYKKVLKTVGASLHRDSIDMRIIDEVRKGTFTYGRFGIIDSQNDVGGYPELVVQSPKMDSDKDGMPDEWENKKGLNASNKEDAVGYDLDKKYTNIEVYINSLSKLN
ncbi:MAG: pectate lyase [Marinilabiliaceae bacterium]|nr:pectate lyase [Marinilabiliaceae bacterium]